MPVQSQNSEKWLQLQNLPLLCHGYGLHLLMWAQVYTETGRWTKQYVKAAEHEVDVNHFERPEKTCILKGASLSMDLLFQTPPHSFQ